MKKWKLGLVGVMVAVFIGFFVGGKTVEAAGGEGLVYQITSTSEKITGFYGQSYIPNVHLYYGAHLETYGWEQGWRGYYSDQGLSSGRNNKRIEGMAFHLNSPNGQHLAYEVQARGYVQGNGWQEWRKPDPKNNMITSIGTTGQYKALQKIEIRIVLKNTPFPRI